MRNKSDLDTLSMDDLYNNLKVYESDIKGQSSSSSNSQNVAFVSSDNSSSTNETVNTAHNVSAASSKDQASTASYADDVMFSFFPNQSNAPQLDYEDLEQIDANDLEEMDLKWQVAMLTMKVKRFIKKTERKLDLNDKETVGFDRTKVEYYNCHRRGHFARECRAPRNQGNRNRDDPRRNAPVDTSTTKALVVQDGIGGYDWSFQAEEGLTNFALMAYTSQGLSSSDSEVHTCSKDCLKSYEALQKQYDQQREALNKSNLEIIVKDVSIKDLKNQLEEALKEKDDLKLKLEKFEESSKNLTKLINSQISAKDKTGLGYDSQINESELNSVHKNESEVIHSVFNSRESDVDDNPVNNRFKIGEGFHAVPPPYTGNYMPPRPDLSFAGLDEYVFKSAVRKTTTSVPETETSISKTSKDIVEKPKTVRPSAPIIEEWDTNNDNDSVFRPKSDQTKPKFTKINFVKSGENVKSVNKENTHRQKACFVCGSFNHLIKDYDFHDNKMVEKPVLNNKGRVTGQREIRPVWNNAQRVNHQTEWTHPHPKRNFVPTAVATKSGQVPVNAAKQSSPRTAAAAEGNRKNVVKSSTCWIWIPIGNVIDHISKDSGSYMLKRFDYGNLQYALQDQGIFDSGCSRHMMKRSYPQIIKKLMVDLLHLEEMLKEGKLVRGFLLKLLKYDHTWLLVRKKATQSLLLRPRTGIKREFSVARTPQQNGVAERKNKTLIEVARTMLTDSKLPTTFWAEVVNTACYVQNRVLVIKPHNKTPYELFLGRKPALSFMRPFGCPVTILNTIDHLGNQTNGNAGTKANIDAGQARKKTVPGPQYVLLPLLTFDSQGPKSLENKVADDVGNKSTEVPGKEKTKMVKKRISPVNAVSSSFTTVDPGRERAQRNEFKSVFGQDKDANDNSTYRMFTHVCAAGSSYVNLGGSISVKVATLPNANLPTDPLMPDLKDIADLQDTGIFSGAYDDEVEGAVADFNNLELTTVVNPIPTTRIHKDHPEDYIKKQRRTNHKDYQNCLFACFLSQIEPKKVTQALIDPSWIEAMQDELLQNKKDERGIVVRNKARLVAQGYTQEKGINYDEVFAPVARIEAIRLFLAYASFMGFIVYQMNVKSVFLYGTIEEEVYVCQPPGFEDP
ncbi:putative ribonuclease H-like domain-containing protein [Tanacetum coccineum]